MPGPIFRTEPRDPWAQFESAAAPTSKPPARRTGGARRPSSSDPWAKHATPAAEPAELPPVKAKPPVRDRLAASLDSAAEQAPALPSDTIEEPARRRGPGRTLAASLAEASRRQPAMRSDTIEEPAADLGTAPRRPEMHATPPNLRDKITTAVSSAAGDGVGAVGRALQGFAARGADYQRTRRENLPSHVGNIPLHDEPEALEDNIVHRAGTAIEQAGKRLPVHDQLEDSFLWRKLPGGLGQFAAFLGAGALSPGAALAMGAGVGADEAHDRAIEGGGDEETALQASELGGAVGLTEFLPVGAALNRASGGALSQVGNRVARTLIATAAGALEEGGQEAFAEVMQNAIQRGLVNPDQELIEGIGEAATVGGSVGAIANLLLQALAPGRGRGTAAETETDQPAAEPIPPEAGTLAGDRGTEAPTGEPVTEAPIDGEDVQSMAAEAAVRRRGEESEGDAPSGSPQEQRLTEFEITRMIENADISRDAARTLAAHFTRERDPDSRTQPTKEAVENAIRSMRFEGGAAGEEGTPRLRVEPPEPRAEAPSDGSLPLPPEVAVVPTSQLHRDPQRFQYKAGTDEDGTTAELKRVEKFDPNKAGVVLAWRDPEAGRDFVVNGHHRHELAERTEHPEMLVRYIDAADAGEARLIGSLTNIAEGRGTAIDAAKVFKEGQMQPADIADAGISLRGAVARDGMALSRLHPVLFQEVATERFPVQRAVVIGESGLTPDEQMGLWDLLKSRGDDLTNKQLGELIRFTKGAGTETFSQESLFGTEEVARSLAVEKAQLSSHIRDRLGKEKRLFGFVSKADRAQQLEGAGVGSVDTKKSGEIADAAAQVEEVYARLSTRSGPVADALNRAAHKLAQGEPKREIHKELYAEVRGAIEAELTGAAGAGAAQEAGAGRRSEARGGEAAEVAERQDLFGEGVQPTVEQSGIFSQRDFAASEKAEAERTGGRKMSPAEVAKATRQGEQEIARPENETGELFEGETEARPDASVESRGVESNRVEKLREELAEVEQKIARLQSRVPDDELARHFPGGRVGGSGNPSRLRRLNRRKERDLERTIDVASELVPLYRDRDRLQQRIKNEESGRAGRHRNAREERARKAVEDFVALKPGDEIQMGNSPVRVKRKNRLSVTTDTGTRWSIEEITGLSQARARALLEEVESAAKPPATTAATEDVEDGAGATPPSMSDPVAEAAGDADRLTTLRRVAEEQSDDVAETDRLFRSVSDPQGDAGSTSSGPIGNRMKGRLDTPAKKERGKPVSHPEVMRSLASIAEAAGKALPIRVGRFNKKRARGIFSVQDEVVRIDSAQNIPTAAHEVAHALEKILFGWPAGGPWKNPRVSNAVQRELLKLGKDLYGERTPAGGYKREGWAEFIRYWMTTDEAAAKAPKLHEWFEGTFSKEFPEVRKALDEARTLATQWRSQGALARAEQSIVDPASPKERLKQGLRRFRSFSSFSNWVEMAQPLHEMAKEAEARTGEKLAIEKNPFLTLSALRMTHSTRARYMVEEGMIDLHGNRRGDNMGSLREAVAPVKGRRKEFMIYLWARRAISLWLDPQGPREPGITLEDAQQIVAELETPEFELAAGKVYQWNEGVLDYAAEASETFRQVVATIRERDPGNYLPLQREFDELDAQWGKSGGSGKPTNVARGSLSKRLTGSGRRIKDPFQSMIAKAEATLRAAHERLVVEQMLELSKVEGMGHFMEKVPVDQIPAASASLVDIIERLDRELSEQGASLKVEKEEAGNLDLAGKTLTFFTPAQQPKGQDPIVPIWEEGKVSWYQVDPEMYRALGSLDVYYLSQQAGPFRGLVRWGLEIPAEIFRAGTVGLRASFGLITNPTRDVQTFYANTRSKGNAGQVFAAWAASMGEAVAARGGKRSETYDLFVRLGGEMAQPLGQDIPHTRRASRALFESKGVRVIDVRNWFDFFRDIVQTPESAPRTAEIRLLAKEMGVKPGQALTMSQSLQLLLAAKQVTVDFTAAGELARATNRVVPFFNAGIQGPRAAARAAKDHPVRYATRALQFTALALVLWHENKDEDWYQEMDYREKFMYWHVPFTYNGEKQLARIPRSFELNALFVAMPEMLVDAWYQENPEQARAWFDSVFETNVPNPLEMPVPKQIYEQARNEETYWDSPIVPQGEMRRPAEEQYNEYTTRAAVKIGDIFNVSPRRVDHAMRGLAGPVSTDLLDIVGLGGKGSDREKELADTPIVGRLFQRGGPMGTRPRSINKMFQALENAQKRQASVRHTETPEERIERLQLDDAASAVSSLLYVRSQTVKAADRRELTEEVLGVTREVLRDVSDGLEQVDYWNAVRREAEAREKAVRERQDE